MQPEEALFFAGRPSELLLYEQFLMCMKAALPPFHLRVQKTQITFTNQKVFACVSLKWKGCMVVSFGLPDRIASERIYQAAEIRPNRWTHHVKVSSVEEMDDELLGWIKAAYAFAAR